VSDFLFRQCGRADGVGVLLREDRSDLSIMIYECYMPGLDASAGYIWSRLQLFGHEHGTKCQRSTTLIELTDRYENSLEARKQMCISSRPKYTTHTNRLRNPVIRQWRTEPRLYRLRRKPLILLPIHFIFLFSTSNFLL
jgi:hypothetical protein